MLCNIVSRPWSELVRVTARRCGARYTPFARRPRTADSPGTLRARRQFSDASVGEPADLRIELEPEEVVPEQAGRTRGRAAAHERVADDRPARGQAGGPDALHRQIDRKRRVVRRQV